MLIFEGYYAYVSKKKGKERERDVDSLNHLPVIDWDRRVGVLGLALCMTYEYF